jgi:hypothetical protein
MDTSVCVLLQPSLEFLECFATMGDLVLLIFGHFGICTAFVLEGWIPT